MTKSEILLVQLMEECAEVIRAVSKVLRFGPNDHYYEDEKRIPLNHLQDELNDLSAVVETLQSEGVISWMNPDQIAEKKEKIRKFLEYSRQKGILTDGSSTN